MPNGVNYVFSIVIIEVKTKINVHFITYVEISRDNFVAFVAGVVTAAPRFKVQVKHVDYVFSNARIKQSVQCFHALNARRHIVAGV